MLNGDDAATSKRNKPASIIIGAVTLVVAISAVVTFLKIGSNLDDMNSYSGAATQARQALNDLEKISMAGLTDVTDTNAKAVADDLAKRTTVFEQDIYGLNHNKMVTSDLNAHGIYTVIEIKLKSFADSVNQLVVNLHKLANRDSYELIIPDKSELKAEISDLVEYLEQKALE